MKMAKSVRVGITIGDKNGVGPEVILKALEDERIMSGIIPIIYGCDSVLQHYKHSLGMDQLSFELISSAKKSATKKNKHSECLK